MTNAIIPLHLYMFAIAYVFGMDVMVSTKIIPHSAGIDFNRQNLTSVDVRL